MKKHFLFFLIFAATLNGFAQEILFIGLFSNASGGKSYWCRDMEMVKQVVGSEAEAQQLATDFRKEHAKESPVVKIVRKGSIIIYDYQKEDKAFNCSYRVISWKEGNNKDEARQALKKDEESIKKEFNGQPNELFAWGLQRGEESNIEISFTIEGILIVLKKVNNVSGNGTWIAQVKNPLNDDAAFVLFSVDGVQNPLEFKNAYKLQPGEVLNVNLGKGAEADVMVRLGEKDEVEGPGVVHQIKTYIRQSIQEKNGKLEKGKMAPFTIRG